MLATLALLTSSIALASAQAPAGGYTLQKSYFGADGFDSWSFYGHYDNLTNGDVIFVNQSASSSLAYIDASGNAIIKVDNTSVVPYNEKRDTVRIQSTETYGIGNMWVFDATHVPYGCSVWPAFWSVADDWPTGGEIDTFEAVNLQTNNQYALHTEPGCTSTATSAQQLGSIQYPNCDSSVNQNSGCTTSEPSELSYGADFATSGGGVYVTELSTEGVSIWFFPRAEVPDDLLASNTSARPNPANWNRRPSAFYPSSSCDPEKYFKNQRLTISITLCGDYAGTPSVFNATCSGVCYTDYVLNATNYNTAYFEIPSLRVYTNGNVTNNAGGSSAAVSGSSSVSGTASRTSAQGSATAQPSSGAERLVAGAMAFVGGVAGWALL